jgi:transposase
VRRHKRDHHSETPSLDTSDRARLRELERRNAELERENSFLKKAAAYFAKDHR